MWPSYCFSVYFSSSRFMLILYIRVPSVPSWSGPEVFYICQGRWASWNGLQEGKEELTSNLVRNLCLFSSISPAWTKYPWPTPKAATGRDWFALSSSAFSIMSLIFICCLSSSHLKGLVISQGRSGGLRSRSAVQDKSAGRSPRRRHSPLCAKCLSCVWHGTAARELSLSLAASEFSHSPACSSARVRSGAQDCIQEEQITDAAKWMLPTRYLWSSFI